MFGKSDDSKDKDSKNSSSSSAGSGEPKDTKTGTSPPNNGGRRRLSKASQLIASAKNTFSPSSLSVNPSTTEEQKSSFRVLPPRESEENTTSGNSAGDSQPGPRNTFRVGVTEDRNRKCRRTMEDTHSYIYNFLSEPSSNNGSSSSSSSGSTGEATEVVDSDNGYFAIFDGHAGTYAADWCGRKLHLVLEEVIRKHSDRQIPELLDMTFTQCDAQLEKLPVKNSGCTAVCAVLRWEDRDIPIDSSSNRNSVVSASGAPSEVGKHGMRKERQRILYTANVGDARIVLCRGGRGLRLSYDHKGSDENEGKRVANAGGLILNNRVNGVLAVTRALGDSYMKELVTGHPYTTESVLSSETDEFIILACDGLWDVCTDQEAVDLVRDTYDPQEASKILVDHALSRFSSDNLSCMVVRLDWSGKFEKLNKREDGAVSSESLESIAEDPPKEENSSSSIDGKEEEAVAGTATSTAATTTTTSTGTQPQGLPDLIPPAKPGPVELNLDQSKLLDKRRDEPEQKSLALAPAATETAKTETPPGPAQAKAVQEAVESLKKDSVSLPTPTTTAKGTKKQNENEKEELQKRS